MKWNFDGYQELYEEDLQRINGGVGALAYNDGVVPPAHVDTTIYTQTETVVHTPNTPEPTAQAMPSVASYVNGSIMGVVAQTCSDTTQDHCDIIAQNLAVAAGLTNTASGNLNILSVNDTYNRYQSSAVQTTPQGFVGTGNVVRGYMFFDWVKKETYNGSDEWIAGDLGDMDHMEFCEISADGLGYTVWQNNGGTQYHVVCATR